MAAIMRPDYRPALSSIYSKGKGRAMEISPDLADQSMHEKLSRWRAGPSSKGSSDRPCQRVLESDLLRDAVLLLQGINGRYTRFQDTNRDIARNKSGLPLHPLELKSDEPHIEGQLLFVVHEANLVIPAASKQILTRLGEVGWLYRRISQCIEGKLHDSTAGTIELALCHNLQLELRSYDALIAAIETSRHKPETLNSLFDKRSQSRISPTLFEASEMTIDSEKSHLTLHKILNSVNDFKLRMRMMAVLADACASSRGGTLLSQIHGYTKNGDPFVKRFASSILESVSQPFFRFLAAWIYEGELRDPNHEFFVESQAAFHGSPDLSLSTWSGRYRLNTAMVPSFLDSTFADKIFSTGRSLNYLKYACADTEWVNQRQKRTHLDKAVKLDYGDIAGLQNNIDVAYKTASHRLFSVFFDKFKLMKHLNALKDYMLLGRGDFVDLLIEQLGPSLNRPAHTLYRHTLTAFLETAIRGSTSSTDDEEVLGRLDARILDYEHGELGWDVFTLEYKVDAPVDVVLDGRSMALYSKLFAHLWRIKRVEYALSEGWKRIMNEARYYNRVADLRSDFHKARATLAEMIHVVKQLQYFSHLEVIECSWTALNTFIEKGEGDLDALVDAHTSYVNRLASKALLKVHSRKGDTREEDAIMNSVKEAFKIALRFRDSLDALCNYALAEASRDSTRASSRHSPDSHVETPIEPEADPEQLAAIRKRLHTCSSSFQDLAESIVTSLAAHPDLDLRFLSCRINFSLFYLVGKSKK